MRLPAVIAVGGGTALFLAGTCYCPSAEIDALEFLVDGQAQPVATHGMPRLDFFRSLHPGLDPYDVKLAHDPASATDPELRGYASGFWGLITLTSARATHEIGLRARLSGGLTVATTLGEINQAPPVQPISGQWPGPSAEPRIAIAMATFDPPPRLLERQLASIREQTHRNWVCVISDDCSRPERFAALQAAVAGDARFVLSRAPRRLGFYRNFERALALAPGDADLVALSDQDDAWYPEKLATLARALGEAQLVYSDARVVDPAGNVTASTYWASRANNHSDIVSLLSANAVTGAAALMPRSLLEDALPFPPAQFHHYHDHWLGLVALARGEVAFVAEPLYDYVQHGAAELGHETATSFTSLRARLLHQRGLGERVRMWRLHYFVDIWRLRQFATVLLLRCGSRLPRNRRRALERFLAADRGPPPLGLAARGIRDLLRTRPETMGAEWMLFCALLWRRALARSARARPQRRLRLDAVPPPSLSLPPGRRPADGGPTAIAEKIAPLDLTVVPEAPRRINLLIPTVDLAHFFGGYIAKLNLARRLAERGHRVRVLTVDPVPALPADWRRQIESYSGLEGALERVEVEFGRGGGEAVEISPTDGFIATTWWTAHIAEAARSMLAAPRFVYLIQEYEPFTFPMGTFSALAAQSYGFPHFALFSSELLRGYFRAHRLGVYAAGPRRGDGASLAFENAITPVAPPQAEELLRRRPRRLLFYARPEPHAARNMFDLGVLALREALQQGGFSSGWELNGVGSVQSRQPIDLGGVQLNLLPRSDQRAYGELLRAHDVGLALMYTPHPSLVPIEMASAGIVTVTNTFENKTATELEAISGNLIAEEPTIPAVAGGLLAAERRAEQVAQRVTAASVRWSADWLDSFPDPLLARLESALEAS